MSVDPATTRDGGPRVDAGTVGPADGGAAVDGGAMLSDSGSRADAGSPDAPMTVSCPEQDLAGMVGVDVTSGSTVGRGTHVTQSCNDGTAEDVTFRWVAPNAGTFTFDTLGSSFDTVLSLHSMDCGAEIACNDDAALSYESSIRLDVTAGQELVIAVGGFGGESGAFVLSISEATADEVGACTDGADNDRDGAADCDDDDCAMVIGCFEDLCDDDVDNDGDGPIDCDDYDCSTDPACSETICDDDVDNDGDGPIDCADYDCARDPACFESVCDDGRDNDHDGTRDCRDRDCDGTPTCTETNCTDGRDNEHDGRIDCADPDCSGDPACIETDCADGRDDEGDGTTDCDDWDCYGDSACGEAGMCTDTIDNDMDTHADCEDSECRCDPACTPETCPAIRLPSRVTVTRSGSTAGSCGYRSGSCGGGGSPEATFRWVAPRDGTYRFSTSGSDYDTVLYLLATDCAGMELDCNDDTGTGLQSEVSASLSTGDVVIVVLDGFGGDRGDYNLAIERTGPPT